MSDLPDYVQFARRWKENQIRNSRIPDIPPHVIAIKGGRQLAVAIAPKVDRDSGLYAASLLHAALDTDELIFIADTCYVAMTLTESQTIESAKAARYAKFPKRLSDSRGRPVSDEIREAITIVRVDRAGECTMTALRYRSDIKERRVLWEKDSAIAYEGAAAQGGDVPEALAKIMGQPLMRDHQELRDLASSMGLDPDDTAAFDLANTNATFRLLRENGFFIDSAIEGTE